MLIPSVVLRTKAISSGVPPTSRAAMLAQRFVSLLALRPRHATPFSACSRAQATTASARRIRQRRNGRMIEIGPLPDDRHLAAKPFPTRILGKLECHGRLRWFRIAARIDRQKGPKRLKSEKTLRTGVCQSAARHSPTSEFDNFASPPLAVTVCPISCCPGLIAALAWGESPEERADRAARRAIKQEIQAKWAGDSPRP